jgi:hypothetical protein
MRIQIDDFHLHIRDPANPFNNRPRRASNGHNPVTHTTGTQKGIAFNPTKQPNLLSLERIPHPYHPPFQFPPSNVIKTPIDGSQKKKKTFNS